MKQFTCADVHPGCRRAFRGTTDQDVLSLAAGHVRLDHGVDEPAAVVPLLVRRIASTL